MKYQANICSNKITVREALKTLDQQPIKTLFVQDESKSIIGSLTDGDIRRGLLQEHNIDDNVMKFAQTEFNAIYSTELTPDKLRKLKSKSIFFIPLLDENNKLIKVLNLNDYKSYLPIDGIIMAGGLGSRLRPLTNDTPKPMLKVGDKPIIEYNLNLLKSYGIHNVGISVRYLADKIIDHYKDGSDREQKISYIHEDEPLGTIGAARKFEKFENDYVLIMNSDLLTNIDLARMFQDLLDENADMVVATTEYKVNVPYGVVETTENRISALKEKPTYVYYSNAGIYIIKKKVIEEIPKGKHFNATDLIELLLKNNKNVLNYPIQGYWLDIGKKSDFEKALKDVAKIDFE